MPPSSLRRGAAVVLSMMAWLSGCAGRWSPVGTKEAKEARRQEVNHRPGAPWPSLVSADQAEFRDKIISTQLNFYLRNQKCPQGIQESNH